MGKRINRVWVAAALAAAAGASADFAPLKVGNTWTYKGVFHVRPMISSWGPSITDSESVSLKVVSRRSSGDSILFEVELRDSLFRRAWDYRAAGRDSIAHPADTVLKATRTIVSVGDAVTLLPKPQDDVTVTFPYASNPRYKYPVFNGLAYLIAHNALPGTPTPVAGTPARYRAYDVTEVFPGYGSTRWDAWYLDNAGMYWGSMREDWGAGCGPLFQRVHRLERFNGERIDLVAEPPAVPLLKEAAEARIACSLARRAPGGRIAFPLGNRNVTADLAGRILIRR